MSSLTLASCDSFPRHYKARACLHWSERKPHLAGSLGAALLERLLADQWIRRVPHSRAMVITGKGRELFFEKFGMAV